MVNLLLRVLRIEAAVYLAVSVACLAIDIAALFVATRLGASNSVGTAIGYTIGLISHYFMSTRLVFAYRRHAAAPLTETGIYVLTGVLGLAVSYAIVWVGDQFGWLLRYSKGLAIIVSFVLVYQARKLLLFTRRSERSHNS